MEFRSKPLEARRHISAKFLKEYPERIPVVLLTTRETAPNIKLHKHKFLVPLSSTLAEFAREVRHHMNRLDPSQAIFILTYTLTMVVPTMTLGSIYSNYKDEDGFLYLYVCQENTFG